MVNDGTQSCSASIAAGTCSFCVHAGGWPVTASYEGGCQRRDQHVGRRGPRSRESDHDDHDHQRRAGSICGEPGDVRV